MDVYCGNFSYLLGLIILVLLAAPGQLEQTTRTAVQGGEASLKCPAKPKRCSDFEWRYSDKRSHGSFRIIYRDGNVLNDSNGKYSVTAESSSEKCVLVIKNVSMDDSGTYFCTDNDKELLEAELIVFDKYPSELFCSLSVRPNEPLIGSSICHLSPDSVEASCEMRFKDNSDLSPQLEWSVDGKTIQADESKGQDGATVSRIRVSATDLQTSSMFVCRVKYKNNDIQTNLTWSRRLDATIIRETSDLIEVPCGQTIVNCSEIDNAVHSYLWVNASDSKMSDKAQLDLNGKPKGIYSCSVTRSVRGKLCLYTVTRINFTCNDTQSGQGASKSMVSGLPEEGHNGVVIGIVLLCVVGVTVGIAIFIVRMRNRKTRNLRLRANNDEGTNEQLTADANMNNEQFHSDENVTVYEQQSQTEVASASKE